ncbi:hypothetical protein [Bradyrhizobium sp. LHD-71]|uniref:hypothetical protein n=1 Tax=Bradyrhizobium sp. LHD-71 TaxID=3072141 RepID=UPI00280E6A5E|nr:hypothetical protein [Bradyrhizobium sp. LHD-71]MDQ8728585.1 hypothetical protein [Bradyrhizobium sp. LHD-71]
MTKANDDTSTCDDFELELGIADSLMASFCRALESSRLPPMQVLEMMARSLGGVYREVSAAHHRGDCPCGWHPDAPHDLHLMQKALVAGTTSAHRRDLKFMAAAGRA